MRRLLATLFVVLLAAGCGPTVTTHHRPGNPLTPSSGLPDGERPLATITVTGETVSPNPGRVTVKVGERVRLAVTSDRADEVHVHGYDLTRPLRANELTAVEFTADRAGVFDVETHGSGLLLTQLAVE